MDLKFIIVLMITCSFSIVFAVISRKELRNNEGNQERVPQLGRAVPPNSINPSRVTQLSWRPRVFLYKGFLSDEECDHLISSGNINEEKSGRSIVDSEKAKELPNYDAAVLKKTNAPSVPTKKSTFSSQNISRGNINEEKSGRSIVDSEKAKELPNYEAADAMAARIDERISAWTFLPQANSNSFQILHFGLEDGKENYHYFIENATMLHDESVLATVILYLSNVSEGGQILFPEAESGSSKLKNKNWSDCTKSSYVLRPTKGNAVLFFNLHPNTTTDITSHHARCPVLDGDMWAATKVFNLKANVEEKSILQADDNECTDEDENCPRWAAIGECKRNPVFMIGSPDYYGTCRKSCNVC